jgi:hypothetical protein
MQPAPRRGEDHVSVTCCPLQSGDEDGCSSSSSITTPVARKQHACCECDEPILIGTKHERYAIFWDGTAEAHRTCLSCVEIRDHFACSGWIFGQVWSDIEENFFPNMKAGGPCMDGLSVAAKARLFERRLTWLNEQPRVDES